jgi:hypothetical protein
MTNNHSQLFALWIDGQAMSSKKTYVILTKIIYYVFSSFEYVLNLFSCVILGHLFHFQNV